MSSHFKFGFQLNQNKVYKCKYIYIAKDPYLNYNLSISGQKSSEFEWDPKKDFANREKHGVSFLKAQYAFADPNRVILEDITHSTELEKRYFCLGIVDGGILTVRFTFREPNIRIIGAGYWRKGKRIYEKENRIQ